MSEEFSAVEETKAIAEMLERLLQESDDRPALGFLTGFVAAVEWMNPDGTYAFWRYNGDASGHALPAWRINGMCDYAKGSDFVNIEEEDIEE